MRVTTIAEVAGLDDGDIIKAIRGTIRKVERPIKGGSGEKAYHFQTAEFFDGRDTIKLKLSGCQELGKDWEGVEVYIVANQSEKHGWTGIKVKDEDYQSKKGRVQERVIWVTPTAQFLAPDQFDPEQHGGEPEKAQQAAPPPPPPPPPPRTSAPPRSSPPPRSNAAPAQRQAPVERRAGQPAQSPSKDPRVMLADGRRFYGREANSYATAFGAALHALVTGVQAAEATLVATPTPRGEIIERLLMENMDQICSVASTLYISARNSGQSANFPSGAMPAPIRKDENPPPQPPPPQNEPDPEEDDVPF